MKFSYKFSNLLGTVYRKGDLLFSPDGSSVISPVGNRITIYDLKNNKSTTLPVESRFNYVTIDISPNGGMLVAVNADGEIHVISMISKVILHKYRLKGHPKRVKFSRDGKHFAVCKGGGVFVFNAPRLQCGDYNPFVMTRAFHESTAETTCLNWSFDSKLLAVGSKDTTVKIYSLQKWANFRVTTLGCHSDVIVGCFFESKNYDIYTISKNGRICIWQCTIDPDDLVEWKPPVKKRKPIDSDSEDDIDTRKAIEKPKAHILKNNFTESENLPQDNAVEEVNAIEEDIVEENNIEIKRLGYKKLARHYLADEPRKHYKDAKLTAATYHCDTHMLVVGFNNGSFYLYEMPDVNMIHSLSISRQRISSVALNSTGDWIAVGCSHAGQLLVWEWQSETYAMKQQGHRTDINCLAYSPDGQYIVTGGDDGKMKLWNTMTGFCTLTFHEHTSSVSSVLFSHNRKFIASASLDGTVRAYDLVRYRNFRTLTSPRPVQFSCMAIDASDEFLAAGGQDFFEIFLWSMKLGTLLEVLGGHEGPVASLAFNPNVTSTELASVSWDKTLKIWNAIENGSAHETIQLTADALYVTYKPNGEEVAVATLDGQISFFNCKTATQRAYIEGRNDLGAGRTKTDLITAKKNLQGKAFTSLCYSADGICILAGGRSKNVCIYNTEVCTLLKKFEITQNRSLDGVDEVINRRYMSEFGNKALIEYREGGNISLRLPGVKTGDMASRRVKPEVRVLSLQFSPTGQAWAAATTEGLLIYSLDVGLMFDPFQLELGITPDTAREMLEKQEYAKALMMALKLNEKLLTQQILETIPYKDIGLTTTSMPDIYIEKLLKFIASELEPTRHIHFYLLWIETILTKRGSQINAALQMPVLLMLQKNMQKKYDDLSKICDFNQYTLNYILNVGELKLTDKLSKHASDKNELNDDDDSVNHVTEPWQDSSTDVENSSEEEEEKEVTGLVSFIMAPSSATLSANM
ncbi:periodic tryptophan protein 2 homolog isoform X2 [Harpegnathos saltator]|uniref:periodic tryptophan protein 2 homolog isoform X2 n=1 Tax=Harpegnathos saltator TaxID=610380 RepID=UPI00058C14D9|nr:periodic tryptophan protein 2 homolog isoform X2 [Harpegnathos saltator]